jgi:hypothetical protein
MRCTPDQAWGLLADITRMGEWSPETTSAVWRKEGEGPTVGARFKGTNRMGAKKWSSNATVTVCEPGRRFAFHVSIGPFSVADWAYEFEPTDAGCLVSEVWQDRRGALVTWLSPFITGTSDRARRNEETMAVTLDRLAASAESL